LLKTSFPTTVGFFNLPSAPKRFLVYNENQDRPQPLLDKSVGGGMSVCAGNLTQKAQNLYHFIGVSHNLLRGAAGGAILLAELLVKTGYL
jgi:aspartate-semialdehyde dehydrogenase